METFSALLAFYEGNSPVTGEFPSERPVTRSFGVFFDLCLNKRLSKQSRRRGLRRHHAHYDVTVMYDRKNMCEMNAFILQTLFEKRLINPWHPW